MSEARDYTVSPCLFSLRMYEETSTAFGHHDAILVAIVCCFLLSRATENRSGYGISSGSLV